MGNASSATSPPVPESAVDPESVNVDVDDESKTPASASLISSTANKLLDSLRMSKSDSNSQIAGYQVLVTDDNARKWSLWALDFNVAMNAVNTKMLNPNFAIMATPGASDDSFDDTDPFDFNSATYFMPLCSLLGVAIASIFTGQLSDKYGRKRLIQFCSFISIFGSVGMYLARETFWGFCAASFAGGLFRGTLPVSLAYIGDIFTTRKEKSDNLGIVVGFFVMGNAGGGIFAILMNDTGLFTPMLLGAGLMLLSWAINIWYLIEPGDVRLQPSGKAKLAAETEEDDDPNQHRRPEALNNVTLWHIIAGAFADNVGSTALFPMCLSPLALEQFYGDFVAVGEDPIMSIDAYQWLSVCVALMVIPGTLVTPLVFDRVGAAGGCVFGNIATGLLTMALLFIGSGSATTGMFALFVIVMYLGFPLTVVSQLSTGPMLDLIAPVDKIGYCQGLNNTVMNLGMAVAPWVFGLLADSLGTNPTIWIGIGVSFLAGVINWPLMWIPGLGPPEKKSHEETEFLEGEDEDLVEKALKGEYVDPIRLHELNVNRIKEGHHVLTPAVSSYEEDKEQLDLLRKNAKATFEYRKKFGDKVLLQLKDPSVDKQEVCNLLNAGYDTDVAEAKVSHEKLGQWFADYLQDNGFRAQANPSLVKQMITLAFPPITNQKKLTPENVEEAFLNIRRLNNMYMDIKKEEQHGLGNLLGRGGYSVTFS